MIKLSQGSLSCSGGTVPMQPLLSPQTPKSFFFALKNNDEHEHFSVVVPSLVNAVTKPDLA